MISANDLTKNPKAHGLLVVFFFFYDLGYLPKGLQTPPAAARSQAGAGGFVCSTPSGCWSSAELIGRGPGNQQKHRNRVFVFVQKKTWKKHWTSYIFFCEFFGDVLRKRGWFLCFLVVAFWSGVTWGGGFVFVDVFRNQTACVPT